MSEMKKEMTGIQKLMLGLGKAAMNGAIEGYAMRSREKRNTLHKQIAQRMFDRAMQNKLTRPYDKDEIEYIKEGLGIKDTSE